MSSEMLTNAGRRSKGIFRPGFGKLVDDEGKPVKLRGWNLGEKSHPAKVRPITNDRVPDLLNEYVHVVKEVAPILEWRPATPGTNAKFSETLVDTHPNLKKLSDQKIDETIDDVRHREFEE
jgi:hypothetical protein